MKKKVNVFNKGIPVFVFAFLGLVLVSAALVPYISNTITGFVTVSQPLTLKIGTDGSNWEDGPITLSDVVGGETFTFYEQVTNNGNQEVNTYMTTIITDTENDVTCEDFTEILVTVTYNKHDPNRIGEVYNITELGLCDDTTEVGKAIIKIPSNYQSPETEEYRIDATFALNVKPDTYAINTTATLE